MFNITKYIISNDQKKLELYAKSIKDFKEAKSLIDFIKRVSFYDDTNVVPFEVDFVWSEKKIVINSNFLFKSSSLNKGENYESISEILNNNGMHPRIPVEKFYLQKEETITTEETPLINPIRESGWRKLFNFY